MRNWRGRVAAVFVVALAVAVTVSQAWAHVERASYWPDPRPDKSVTPATGGKVPKARSLYTALDAKRVGDTRVVCQSNSIARVRKAIGKARTKGYKLRPSERARHISAKQGRKLLAFNKRLKARCKFSSIQDAVTASGNNDRVVIMPGVYTEPKSRAQPTDDPKCASLKEVNDRQDGNGEYQTGAVSYAYQLECPNDQNLIAVMGRALGTGTNPQPPLENRHGIPNLGPCIRCNFQIEGSGVGSDDVVIDAGRVASGNKGPAEGAKDVGIRADRADGFVLRNMTVRHVNEHAIYVLEADGYLLDRFKTFYARGIRGAHVRGGPRSDAELRGRRQRRLPASIPAPAPRAGTSGCRVRGATRRRFASATCTTTPAATRAPAATPSGCTTTTSTATRSASPPTCSPRRGTRDSRRTRT